MNFSINEIRREPSIFAQNFCARLKFNRMRDGCLVAAEHIECRRIHTHANCVCVFAETSSRACLRAVDENRLSAVAGDTTSRIHRIFTTWLRIDDNNVHIAFARINVKSVATVEQPIRSRTRHRRRQSINNAIFLTVGAWCRCNCNANFFFFFLHSTMECVSYMWAISLCVCACGCVCVCCLLSLVRV